MGERSLGGARGVNYQHGIADRPGYYRQSNDNMFVAVMIEDVEGMEVIGRARCAPSRPMAAKRPPKSVNP